MAVAPEVLEEQAELFTAAGLDVDLTALDKLIGPLPDTPVIRGPGRIRIKERHQTSRWDSQAACRGTPTNTFYPTRHSTPDEMREAKDICVHCPVRWECLAYSLLNWEKIGIWGGFTEIERRELRKMLAAAIRRGDVPEDDPVKAAQWLARELAHVRRSVRRGTAAFAASSR